jgi:hypothetical protein
MGVMNTAGKGIELFHDVTSKVKWSTASQVFPYLLPDILQLKTYLIGYFED